MSDEKGAAPGVDAGSTDCDRLRTDAQLPGYTWHDDDAPSSPASAESPVPHTFLACLPWLWTRILFPHRGPAAESPRQAGLLILLFVPALFLYTSLSFYLFEPDEGRYAQIPTEMLAHGDWLVPRLQGEPYLDKPPLFYWLVMLSYCIFGTHAWAARLVPALAVHGTILLVYVFGCRRCGERSAFWGALALALMPGFLAMARLLVLDGLLTFLVTLTFFALWEAVEPLHGAVPTDTRRRKWWLLAGIGSGLGVLCKGPVILVLTIVPLLLHRSLTGSGQRSGRRELLLFGAALIGVALPWYAAICVALPDFARHFLWQHNVLRFLQPFDHLQPFWYYVPFLLACPLPAGLLLVPLVRSLLVGEGHTADGRTPQVGHLLLAAGWCVLFFSLSGSKLPTYILPAFPPLALALGAYLVARGWHRTGWTRMAAVAAAAMVLVSHGRVVPWLAERNSPMRVAEGFRDLCADRGVPVVCHPRNLDSVAFYFGRDDLHSYRGKDFPELVKFLQRQPRTVILISNNPSLPALRRLLPPSLTMTTATTVGPCSLAIIEATGLPTE